LNAPSSPFSRYASALWTLSFLIPAVALVCWLLRDVRPDIFLTTLYDSGLPIAFRFPLVGLCVSSLAAWALWRTRDAERSPSACVRSPRRILNVALLALALIFSVGFGKSALWTVASILSGIALLEAACGLGLVLMLLPPLNLGDRFRGRAVEQYVLSTALGLGLIACAIFVIGSAGLIHRVGWLIALVAMLAATSDPRARLGAGLETGFLTYVRRAHPLALGALFFTCAWFAIKTALITAAPLEYDVLEYHLAAPLQYLRDGRIHFLSENVYAAMPSSAEMLFLFPLTLFDDPYRGLLGARLILWGAWALSALGVYALTARLAESARDNEPSNVPGTAPVLAAALFAVVPMGAHLAADFYVEHIQTLLHVGAVLAASAFLHDRRTGVRQRNGWLLLSGLLAGACCATKYSGLLFTLAPLLVFVPLLCALNGSVFEGLRAAVTLSVPAALLFAPWALRNWIAGGDPLYPLGLVLQRRARAPLAVPDHLDHLEVALRSGERSLSALSATLGKLWPSFSAPSEESGGIGYWVKEGQIGPHLLAGLPAGLLSVATPEALFVALMLFADVAIWFLFSHRVERFLFPAIPLLAVVCGVGLARLWEIRAARKLAGAYVFVSVIVFAPLGMLYSYSLSRPEVLLGEAKPLDAMLDDYELTGNRPWAEAWRTVNNLPPQSRVLFIGDAQSAYVSRAVDYNVVFNGTLLEEVLASASKPEHALLALKAQGITHLYFNYAEWLRLDSSYALTRSADRNEWEYARIQNAERSVMWKALTSRQFKMYGKAWPPEVKPAYLKLSDPQYALLEELVREHTRSVRVLRGSGGNMVCEIRELQ